MEITPKKAGWQRGKSQALKSHRPGSEFWFHYCVRALINLFTYKYFYWSNLLCVLSAGNTSVTKTGSPCFQRASILPFTISKFINKICDRSSDDERKK